MAANAKSSGTTKRHIGIRFPELFFHIQDHLVYLASPIPLFITYQQSTMHGEQEQDEDDFFIPSGYHLFRIKPTTLRTLQISSSVLPYSSNKATIQDLLKIFLLAYNIPSGQIDGYSVMLGMQDVAKLPLDMQVFELKSKLNNIQAEMLEFQPFLTDTQAFRQQCSSELNFSKSSAFKSPVEGGGKIQVCILLPQIYQEYYYQMNATGTLQDEITKALKQNRERIGSDLSNKSYIAKCPICDQQSSLAAKIYNLFHTHQQIQLIFDHLQRPQQPLQLTKVQLNIMQGADRVIKKVPFISVARKKLKTVLQECGFENAYRLCLRVMGVILKPGDFFSRVQSEAVVMQEGCFAGTILDESELFYLAGLQLLQRSFDLQEVAAAFSSVAMRSIKEQVINKIYTRREQCIAEIEQMQLSRRRTKLHRESSFIDPILAYTSPHFYKDLNKHLRLTNFATLSENQYNSIEYKFSFAILRSLLMLPCYSGKSYRGATFRHNFLKKGDVVCFSEFISSSVKLEKARQFAKPKHPGQSTMYTLLSLSGREISEFSYFKNEAEVVFMPYTYFQVIEYSSKPEGVYITMQEIPMPRRPKSNLIVWVDDKPAEGNIIHQHLLLNYPGITTEIIQLTSNKLLELWLNKFGHIVKERTKVCLITDLKREDQVDGGVETIRMMRGLMGEELKIFVYVGQLQASRNLLRERNLLSDALLIGNQRKEVVQFITEKAIQKDELLNHDTCQLI